MLKCSSAHTHSIMSFYVLLFCQYWACWYYVVYCLIKLLAKSALVICLCVQNFCRIIFCIIIIIIIIIIQCHHHNPKSMAKRLSKDTRLRYKNLKSVHTSKMQPYFPGGLTPSERFTPLWDLGSDQLSTLAHGWLAATTRTITVKLLTGPYNDGTVRTTRPKTAATCRKYRLHQIV